MLSDFINLIFPLNCINCHKVLVSGEQNLCISCKSDLPYTDDFNHPENELFQKLSFLTSLRSAASLLHFSQKNVTQKMLHQLKYKGNEKVGIMLGELLGQRILEQKVQIDTIIPVPIHVSKLKIRGYNQSEKISRGIAQRTGLEIDLKSVIRTRSTTSSMVKPGRGIANSVRPRSSIRACRFIKLVYSATVMNAPARRKRTPCRPADWTR